MAAETILGIWRVGKPICQTAHHQLHAAQAADAAGSNRWPYAIRVGADASRQQTRQFLRAAAAVQHPALVPVIDGSADSPSPFVVMPRIATSPAVTTVPLPVMLWSARQIGQALAALHDAGWVHGRVCPRHIVTDRMGHATLCDLGGAKPIHTSTIDSTTAICPFAAPEAKRLEHAAIAALDVYALGRTIESWAKSIESPPLQNRQIKSLVDDMTQTDPLTRPPIHRINDQLAALEIESLTARIAPVRVAA